MEKLFLKFKNVFKATTEFQNSIEDWHSAGKKVLAVKPEWDPLSRLITGQGWNFLLCFKTFRVYKNDQRGKLNYKWLFFKILQR